MVYSLHEKSIDTDTDTVDRNSIDTDTNTNTDSDTNTDTYTDTDTDTETDTDDWESAYNELEPDEVPKWVKNHGFDIIQDFDEQDRYSFIRNLEDWDMLEYVCHLRFLPDFNSSENQNYNDTKSESSVDSWYGKHDFKKILKAFHFIKESCRNIETIEIVYNTSCKSTEEDDARFDLFIEWLKSLERIKKVDFAFVDYKGIHKCDPILNRLPGQLTSLSISLSTSIKSYKKQRNQVSFNLNTRASHYLGGGSDFLNQVYSNGYIMPLLNIETLKIEIDVFAHEYLMQKFPNVKNLTISGKYAQQELVLAYEDIKDTFLPFLFKIPKYDIQSFCIRNTGLDLMMKDFLEKQEINPVHCLNLIYTSDHDSDNTSVAISKSQSENDDGKKKISYYLYQNKKHMGNVENLLALFGPHLTSLRIDFKDLHKDFSLNKEAFMKSIFSNCHCLELLGISASPDFCNPIMPVKTGQPNLELSNYIASCLAKITSLIIENFYNVSEEDSDILKLFAEKEKNKVAPPILRVVYNIAYKLPKGRNTVLITKNGQSADNVANTTFDILLNVESCSTDKVLQTLGPYTALTDTYIPGWSSFDSIDYILFSLSHNQRKPGYTAYSLSRISQIRETNHSLKHGQKIELKNSYFNEDGLKTLKNWAKEEEGNASHCLNLIYCNDDYKYLNSIQVTKILCPEPSGNGGMSTTIIYNVRLDKNEAYNTTKMALKIFGEFLTGLDIQFEGRSTYIFYFDEKKYLNRIARHCKAIKNLKIRNFPLTLEGKQLTARSSPKEFISHVKGWLSKGELGKTAKKLAKIHFEIGQYPLSETMLSLNKKLNTCIPKTMASVFFSDMIACVESVPLKEPRQPYCPPSYEYLLDHLPVQK